MQSIRTALEDILQLADDTSYSHVARMLKIKGLASQALTDLNNAPVAAAAPKLGRPVGAKTKRGPETGDDLSKPDQAEPPETF